RSRARLEDLHLDRAYLASPLVQQRPDTLTIFCKAWPVQQGPYFSKHAFHLDWEGHTLRCPGGERMPFAPGEMVKFPAATCARCALRERCTTSASGRSVTIHPDEALLQELRERRLCRKLCSGDREGAVAPVCGEITRPGSRTVRPQ